MASKELIEQIEVILEAAFVHEDNFTVTANAILSTIGAHLDHKADTARKAAKDFHDKRKSGKYGVKKQTRFFEEGKHYNRLAIGYAKSACAIRRPLASALGEQSE